MSLPALATFEISDDHTTNTDTFCQIGLRPPKKCACAPYLGSDFRNILHSYLKKMSMQRRVFKSEQYKLGNRLIFYRLFSIGVNQDQVVRTMASKLKREHEPVFLRSLGWLPNAGAGIRDSPLNELARSKPSDMMSRYSTSAQPSPATYVSTFFGASSCARSCSPATVTVGYVGSGKSSKMRSLEIVMLCIALGGCAIQCAGRND
jgi:hypothetical protein